MSAIRWQPAFALFRLRSLALATLFVAAVAEPLNADPPTNAKAPVPAKDAGKKVTEPATVEAWQKASLFPRIHGIVATVKVDIGDRVKAGDLLVELSAPDIKADFDIKQAQVTQAMAEVDRANAALLPIRIEIEDRSKLAQLSQKKPGSDGGASQSEQSKIQAEDSVAAAKARLQVAEASVKVAQVRLTIAKAEAWRAAVVLEYASLRAPYDGIIAARNVNVGDLVFPAANRSQPLLVVASTGRIRVAVLIPENYAPRVETGAAATIEFDSFPGKTFSGRVSRTAGVINPLDRTMLAQIDLANADGRLLPGMFGRATISLAEAAPAVRTNPESRLRKARMFAAQAEVKAAAAAIEEAKSAVRRDKAYFEYRNIKVARLEQLFKSLAIDERLVEESRKDRDAADAALKGSESASRTAEAQLALKNALLAELAAELANSGETRSNGD